MNGKESLPKKPKQKIITKYRTNAETAQKYLELGQSQERERILTQWEYEMSKCSCDDPMAHMERRIKAELQERKEK
jgi:hypothetical protein